MSVHESASRRQHMSVHISISQNMSIDVNTHHRTSIEVNKHKHVSIHASTRQYISIHISTLSMCQYQSIHVSTCQYITVQLIMLTHMTVKKLNRMSVPTLTEPNDTPFLHTIATLLNIIYLRYLFSHVCWFSLLSEAAFSLLLSKFP